MDIRTNAGYIITDCVHIGENEFVLGVHSKHLICSLLGNTARKMTVIFGDTITPTCLQLKRI